MYTLLLYIVTVYSISVVESSFILFETIIRNTISNVLHVFMKASENLLLLPTMEKVTKVHNKVPTQIANSGPLKHIHTLRICNQGNLVWHTSSLFLPGFTALNNNKTWQIKSVKEMKWCFYITIHLRSVELQRTFLVKAKQEVDQIIC